MSNRFDLIVIGAGSGGLAAAKRAAAYGAKVAIVEGDKVGGTCVIRGCVPKKLMVFAANARKNIISSAGYGLSTEKILFNSNILLKNIKDEVSRLSVMHLNSLKKLNIQVFKGWGRFINQNKVEIICSETNKNLVNLSSEKILISVGGRPKSLNILGAELAWTSNEVFEVENFPKSILIVGGGYIACEFASIFNNLDVDVTQLVRSNNILNGFDSDLTSSLRETMTSSGINLVFNDELFSIKKYKDKLELNFKSGLREIKEKVLIATGREPNLKSLNLKSAGIKMHGIFLKVNELNQTDNPNVFAIGDVIDKPNLTPVAIEQGRVFSDKYFGNLNRNINYNYIPKAVFTSPEISTVGLTEKEACDIYEVENINIFKCKFTPMSSTFKKIKSKCLLKLVVNKLNDKVLGCHMFGDSASEIIQIASIALNKGVTKKEFDSTMALHPTVSEEYVTMYS